MSADTIKKKVSIIKNKDVKKNGENESIKKALLEKAMGFKSSEIIEEYNLENDTGKLMLIKKKVTTKQFPPDLEAVEKLIEMSEIKEENFTAMTDFELEQEKEKLLALIKQGESNENNT